MYYYEEFELRMHGKTQPPYCNSLLIGQEFLQATPNRTEKAFSSGEIDRFRQQHPQATSAVCRIRKATRAATLCGSLLTLLGLILVGIVITLMIATPVMMVFSPVLVHTVLVDGLILTGFVTSGGFGSAAVTTSTFLYKTTMGKGPTQQLATKTRGSSDHSEQESEAARRRGGPPA